MAQAGPDPGRRADGDQRTAGLVAHLPGDGSQQARRGFRARVHDGPPAPARGGVDPGQSGAGDEEPGDARPDEAVDDDVGDGGGQSQRARRSKMGRIRSSAARRFSSELA